MQYNEFGKDRVKVSRVGLGCWQLGSDWGEVDVLDANAILKASVDAGVTFFDTADVYGSGRSEQIIGNFLQEVGLQDQIFVATKLGRFGNLYPDNYTAESVRERVEESLLRLKTEALDLVQLHCIPTEVMRGDEIWQILNALVDEGKIKRFGASVESMEEALLCIDKAPELTSLQIIFNIFRQKPIATLFEKAKASKVGIIARVPLASGLLTGKFKSDTTFSESDHRNYNKNGDAFNVGETFAGLPYEKGVELATELKAMAPEGMTMAQMALRWILDHDAVSVVIPGATKVEQAKGNAAIADLPELGAELHDKLSAFYQEKVRDQIRGPY
ncbi:aldo/keto reductase [Pelagicoccus sp. SDUM812003]|uniref:aldo/keto reductase n=1 Tax=Pelagicoccus sp. SDUM812003 TaxID=3041267 RepID=UPI00280EB4E3|nr:aldo/keto reductase [Pelagicoccus sp. SDUM812003]MDQ8203169.1 aldo/keto reductase [Pelagicoccus sp. SDUM812003]